MFTISHDQCSKIAVVGAFAVFTSLRIPAVADELINTFWTGRLSRADYRFGWQ